MSAIIEDFVCPCCTDYALSPIFQCTNSHIICDKCKRKLKNCPLCREEYGGDIRNYKLEELALKLKFPCTNQCYDCKQMLGPQEKQGHEQRCDFMQFTCPVRYNKCASLCRATVMADHLVQKHKVQLYCSDFVNYDIKHIFFLENFMKPFLMIYDHEQFIISIEILFSSLKNIKIVIVSQIIGLQDKADKFLLITSVKNRKCTKRIMMPIQPLNSIDLLTGSFIDFKHAEIDLFGPFSFKFLIKKISDF